MMDVTIQQVDFSVEELHQALREASTNTGAIVTFAGCVRTEGDCSGVKQLFLEHYPGVTEKSIQKIIDKATVRWPLHAVRVVHRIGLLNVGDQIVFVGVASSHRLAAFEAAQFIMDYLKMEAPFWKKEIAETHAHWVEAKTSDRDALNKW